jgi:hypothetical protein
MLGSALRLYQQYHLSYLNNINLSLKTDFNQFNKLLVSNDDLSNQDYK